MPPKTSQLILFKIRLKKGFAIKPIMQPTKSDLNSLEIIFKSIDAVPSVTFKATLPAKPSHTTTSHLFIKSSFPSIFPTKSILPCSCMSFKSG